MFSTGLRREWMLLCISVLLHSSGAILRFVAIGDWGTGSDEQFQVAQAMDMYCGDVGGCDFIVSLGDNFYGDAMTSPDDERFDTRWREVYTGENVKDLVWYLSMGNHDHSVRNAELHQVEFGKNESRWHLPWLWYDFYAMAGESRVHFVAADTAALLQLKHNATAQREFINSTMEESMGDWIIVFGHHPMYSVGDYFGYPRLHEDIQAIMEQTGAQMYMCGHDHNMQHLTRNDSHTFDHVINGSGGRGLYDYRAIWERWVNDRGWKLDYYGRLYGFTAVTMDTDDMLVEHYTYEIDPDTQQMTYVLDYFFTRERESLF